MGGGLLPATLVGHEEGQFGLFVELRTEIADGAIGVVEAFSDFGQGNMLDEGGTQGFVLAVGVESAGGAPAVGSGGNSVAFAPGRSPASLTVFPPAAHRTGRAALPHPALQADHATRTRTTASPHGASPVQGLARSLFPLHDLSPLIIRPVYALITPRGVPSMPHGSFTFACDAAEVSDHLPV